MFGRWGLSGKVGIGNAIPDGDNQWGMFGGGARSIMFQRDESLMEFLETDQVDRLERLLEEQAEASVDISQIKTEQDALKKAMKSADKDTKAELQIKVRELDEKFRPAKIRSRNLASQFAARLTRMKRLSPAQNSAIA